MEVREISERVGREGLTVLVNPQWTKGNLVSDFGIGPWRRRNEEFVASFQQTYVLKQMRISGDNVRSGFFLPHDGSVVHARMLARSAQASRGDASLPGCCATTRAAGRSTWRGKANRRRSSSWSWWVQCGTACASNQSRNSLAPHMQRIDCVKFGTGPAPDIQGAGGPAESDGGLKCREDMGSADTRGVCLQQRLPGPEALKVLRTQNDTAMATGTDLSGALDGCCPMNS